MKFLSITLMTSLFLGCRTAPINPGDDPLSVIANPGSSRTELIAAIKRLDETHKTPPPQFWSGIANDPKCSPDSRRIVVLQLLARHFRPRMKIGDFADILNRPNWLKGEQVFNIGFLAGYVPLKKLELRDSILGFVLCQDKRTNSVATIYLTVRGRIDDITFRNLIRGGDMSDDVKSVPVIEMASWETDENGNPVENAFGLNPAVKKGE